jgi:hypothetical protein
MHIRLYPFSPHNGVTTVNVHILLFSPLNINFVFNEIIIFVFSNFLCIQSFPQPKDIIASLGPLAFMCFCDGWGAGPPHQPPPWGTRIFCPLAFGVPTPLLQGNKI